MIVIGPQNGAKVAQIGDSGQSIHCATAADLTGYRSTVKNRGLFANRNTVETTVANLSPENAGGKPRMLELFCGRGGWSKAFARLGWDCTGVDLEDLDYPYRLVQVDVRELAPEWIAGFDAVVASPPCEEFARAWLPWLRGDHKPEKSAVDLLRWSISLCDRPRRLVECSHFSTHHATGSRKVNSFALWGDVPLLFPEFPRGKQKISGKRPDLRAEIPLPLAETVAAYFTQTLAQESAA